jgi:hypothetical protein
MPTPNSASATTTITIVLGNRSILAT